MEKIKQLFLLSVFTLLSISIAFGQNKSLKLPIDSETNKITYSEVVFVDSLVTKQELYSRARVWFAKTFNSANDVIQLEDKENGEIVGKALLQVYYKSMGMTSPSGYINYTVTIQVKDARYKYEFTNFHHTGSVNVPSYGSCEDMINTKDRNIGFSPQRAYDLFLSQMDQNIKSLIQNLKGSMSHETKMKDKSNW